MPSCCTYNSLLQILIIFISNFQKIITTNDYHHQVLKVDVGQDITMSCTFDEDKIEQVSFMRQMTGDILSLGSELFVYQSDIELKRFSPNRLDLKLISVGQNDSGLYTCMYNDEKLVSFLIEIYVPPRFISYFPLEGSVSYKEGSSLNLSCHAFAIPSVNITWTYKTPTKKEKRTIYHGEELYISSIKSSDSGLYECIASNMYHASISRAFYVTVQYSPRILITNEKIHDSFQDKLLVRCRVCSIPQVDHIYWLKDNQYINYVNIKIKKQTMNDQCSQSIMEIINMKEYQYGRYECRGENKLGYESDFISIYQIPKVRRIKQKFYSDEINRNGRTALLTNQLEKKNKSQIATTAVTTITTATIESDKVFSSNSFMMKISWCSWFFCLFIYFSRPV